MELSEDNYKQVTYKSYYGSRVNLVADPGDVRGYFGGYEGLQMKF